MAAYESYLSNKLTDHALAEDEIERALKDIEPLPKPKQYTG
jgi:tryptophan synthase beta chain